jgi:beta-N-acetylhexosaminidase
VTLERLAAGCLLPSFHGPEAPDWILRRIEGGLGGVTLFADNVDAPEQVRALTARLRAAGDVLLATDEEGGDVTRLEARTGSSYPGHLALGAVDDPASTEEVAAAIAGELADAGIGMNLAPVADVNVDPDNPVIGVRSFGGDPELVARHVAAFVRGTQRQGVAACAKHFPGHGATSVDSHVALPVVSGDLTAALLPFRAAIAAGVRAVMSAHVVVRGVDDSPATLSRRVLTGLLREELGFDGLVLTDALEMRALSADRGVDEAAVAALAAGADAICVGHALREPAVEAIVAAVAAAVREGRLAAERLEEAVERVGATARSTASAVRNGAPGREVGAEAARRALVVRGSPRVPEPPFVLELVPQPNVAAGAHEHGLAALWPGAAGTRVGRDDAVEVPSGRPLVVVARDLPRHSWQRELVASRPGAIVVETGVPGDGADVVTHGAGRASLEAVVAALAVHPIE